MRNLSLSEYDANRLAAHLRRDATRAVRWEGSMDALLLRVADVLDPAPKPVEPTGLGAVVRDRAGRRFIRVQHGSGTATWYQTNAPEATDPRWVWDYIDAVEVLSEGVPA